VKLFGSLIEQWNFDFGYVIPNSTNSWQQVVDAAGGGGGDGDDDEDQGQGGSLMLDWTELSGNITIESTFMDGDDKDCILHESHVLVYYV
jgi:retinal rod rhodopsin-sensitive cGMP 3',5'-cyclic phosphodiesterase subunit delta